MHFLKLQMSSLQFLYNRILSAQSVALTVAKRAWYAFKTEFSLSYALESTHWNSHPNRGKLEANWDKIGCGLDICKLKSLMNSISHDEVKNQINNTDVSLRKIVQN